MTLEPTISTRHIPTISDLDDLPEDVVGEIIDGELIVHPRPDPPHVWAASELGALLIPPFRRGIEGPGGWIILDEPRIQFDPQVLVPDLAGWRRERYQAPMKGPFEISPDWVCEILSPSTERDDRVRKLPIFAQSKVQYAWLVDPLLRTLEVLRLSGGSWVIAGAYQNAERVRAEPFDAIEIDLSQIWGEGAGQEAEQGGGESTPR
jgi:Uma2 family endonuclease